MKKINVLSLFDGKSCGRSALEKLNENVGKYYSSEIDKYANAISRFHYPDIIRLGDVTKWQSWDIDWKSIDLVMAGSPCQGFSFAGKQLAFDDPRSALFFEFVKILAHIRKENPKVQFFLENVKMKTEFKNVISMILKTEPVQINSSLLSAQNRVRLYWANWKFEQPTNKQICLKDILQDDYEVDEKYYLTQENIEKIDFSNLNKEFKSDIKIVGHRKGYRKNYQVFLEEGKTETLDTCSGGGRHPHILKINKEGKLKTKQDKASCLTGGGNSGGNHSDMDLLVICGAQRGRHIVNGVRKDTKGVKTTQQFELRSDCKTNCLTTVQKDNLIIKEATKKGFVEVEPGNCVDITYPNSKTRRGRLMLYKSNCLTASNFNFVKYNYDFSVRRLTPLECERLQTLPDDYTKYGIDENDKQITISDMQRYKTLGNGWTADVIAHILSFR